MFVTKFRVALYVKSGLFKLLLRQSTRRSNIIPGDVYFKSPPEYLHSGKSSLAIIKLISGGQLQVSGPRRGLDYYARKEKNHGVGGQTGSGLFIYFYSASLSSIAFLAHVSVMRWWCRRQL